MECFKIEDLSFTYPGYSEPILKKINFTVDKGEFVTIFGKSGCGKTTLLRLLKPILSPCGKSDGKIFFNGQLLSGSALNEQASKIGFVFQDPDSGIVTDKVWHELAFGPESMGMPNNEIRTRVAEIASYFGIQTWFHRSVNDLSGGQKQILCLASIMVMQPDVLILDEPTSQLDPITARDFIKTLEKVNRELGTTIILTEHRLEDAIPVSDRVILLDNGCIIANEHPRRIASFLKDMDHDMRMALPVPMRIFNECEIEGECPLDVREGKAWLERFASVHDIRNSINVKTDQDVPYEPLVELKDVWFRYEKDGDDIIKGLNAKICKSEIYAIVGGNGAGKSTALSLISGIKLPHRGKILVNGFDIADRSLSGGYRIAALPQNPQALFLKKTVYLDLADTLCDRDLSKKHIDDLIMRVSNLCHLDKLLQSHPYDLSGGEQQRAALAKVLLMDPDILLLDEPTKGMDAYYKDEFADILFDLKRSGVTVIMVSHDIEFCAYVADRCAMFFDGCIISEGDPHTFFDGNSFYTTSANRISRGIIRSAVLTEDVVYACTGKRIKRQKNIDTQLFTNRMCNDDDVAAIPVLNLPRLICGFVFLLLFIATAVSGIVLDLPHPLNNSEIIGIICIIFAILALACFFPLNRSVEIKVHSPVSHQKNSKKTIAAIAVILLAIPLTIFCGIHFFDDRKYYFISLLIIFETMIPFFMAFENRKPKAGELVVISTLCAIAVAGRAAFFMIPQFKPVIAIVIISGICLGGETGFLVGSLTGFVSNMLFGQGPWTPWQMFAFGLIGFLSGALFKRAVIGRTKLSISIFGFIATYLFYGGIMNASYIVQSQIAPTLEMFATVYLAGLPFDLIHSLSTSVFLWLLSAPMIEKIERVKIKYGMIE